MEIILFSIFYVFLSFSFSVLCALHFDHARISYDFSSNGFGFDFGVSFDYDHDPDLGLGFGFGFGYFHTFFRVLIEIDFGVFQISSISYELSELAFLYHCCH